MNKEKFIYVLLILIYFANSSGTGDTFYRSMSKRKSDFDGKIPKSEIKIDDLCFYTHYHEVHYGDTDKATIYYVKGCKDGKICKLNDNLIGGIGTCQEYNKLSLLTLDQTCKYQSQCDNGLYCLDGKCTLKEGYPAYYKNGFYFCPNNLSPIKIVTHSDSDYSIYNNRYYCLKSSDFVSGDYYKYNDNDNKIYYKAPDFMKVEGEIEFDESTESGTYHDDNNKEQTYSYTKYTLKNIKTASIGSLEDGKYVNDEMACKSGFAIYYHGGNQLDVNDFGDVENVNKNLRFLRCITVSDVELMSGTSGVSNQCIIKYTLDGEDYTVNLQNRYSSNYLSCLDIKIKIEMFKKYTEKMSKCKSEPYDDEPYTCKDDELRKYLYFYNNPSEYRLYKDEDEVIDYLLKEEYNSASIPIINTILLLFLFFL